MSCDVWYWSELEDGRAGEACAVEFDGAHVIYTLSILRRASPVRERSVLVIRCYEDGTVTAAWSHPSGG